ncbi:hypothetical protein LB505_009650 [Fusarium chuoi]|nr:hypothetical protein LB505_009650 [Fusarium chuoi]
MQYKDNEDVSISRSRSLPFPFPTQCCVACYSTQKFEKRRTSRLIGMIDEVLLRIKRLHCVLLMISGLVQGLREYCLSKVAVPRDNTSALAEVTFKVGTLTSTFSIKETIAQSLTMVGSDL